MKKVLTAVAVLVVAAFTAHAQEDAGAKHKSRSHNAHMASDAGVDKKDTMPTDKPPVEPNP